MGKSFGIKCPKCGEIMDIGKRYYLDKKLIRYYYICSNCKHKKVIYRK